MILYTKCKVNAKFITTLMITPLVFPIRTFNVLKEHLTQSTETAIRWFESNHMRANPSKFQAINMKAGHCNEPVIINVHGQDLAPSECVKLLGIFIDNKLTFHKHISTICTRASRQINAMTRVSKFLSKDSKLKLFNAFILSNFLYCSIVWHFCSNHDTYKMEKVQKRALRLVLNDYVDIVWSVHVQKMIFAYLAP